MSATDLSGRVSPAMVTSSAPLPIPMHILSPEQPTNCFPGHLSLGEHDSLQVSELTDQTVCITLATINSWGFPISPTSVQNILAATTNISADQFQSIISGLSNTICIRDNVYQEKVKGLEAKLAVLQQRVDGEDNGLTKCLAGYEENMSYNNLVAIFDKHKNLAIVPRPRDDLPKTIKGGASWGQCYPQHDHAGPTYFIIHGD